MPKGWSTSNIGHATPVGYYSGVPLGCCGLPVISGLRGFSPGSQANGAVMRFSPIGDLQGYPTLCRFRQRLGAEGFQELFNQVVEPARAQGLVSR